MPRMVGQRERKPFNEYDALIYNVRQVSDGHFRLFGNANVGNAVLTNTIVGNRFAGDSPGVIRNWYGRTNLPPSDLLDAVANAIVVTLVVGERVMRQLTLYDLLRRQQGQDLGEPVDAEEKRVERIDRVESLAQTMYRAHGDDYMTSMIAAPNLQGRAPQRTWSDVSKDEQRFWVACADTAERELNPSQFLIVPVRQSRSVCADVYDLTRFNELLSRHECPGIWIHLEGMLTRDVC